MIVTQALDNGVLQVQLMEDGKTYHRTSLIPGEDVAARIADLNAHLAQLGKAEVDVDSLVEIETEAAATWTPEVIAAYQAAMRP